MVAAISATSTPTPNPNHHHNSRMIKQARVTRPPLLPGDNNTHNHDNVAVVPPPTTNRKPKSREINSRYLSSNPSTPSRRFPSPLVSSRTPAAAPSGSTNLVGPTPKRAQSVERTRRPVTPRPGNSSYNYSGGNNNISISNVSNGSRFSGSSFSNYSNSSDGVIKSNAAKMLFTSTRSLSVSFQGESFALQVSKAKPAPSPSARGERRGSVTPDRRKPTPMLKESSSSSSSSSGNSSHRWPARLRAGDNLMSKSLDLTEERRIKLGGGGERGSGSVMRALLQKSMIDEKDLVDGKPHLGLTGTVKGRSEVHSDAEESISSGNASSLVGHDSNQGPNAARGIHVPTQFLPETNIVSSNSHRLRPESPSGRNAGFRTTVSNKATVSKRLSNESPIASPKAVTNTRGLSSPLRGVIRPQSPSRVPPSASSLMRGMSSPARVRNGTTATSSYNLISEPSVLSFAADVRRGRIGENKIEDAHTLRLLHNRLLEWHFINVKANAALSAQTVAAERSLCNAWLTTSNMRESVKEKRKQLQSWRLQLKLASILKEQMTYLEEWALMDREHSSSLSGATEALKASTLRLPVVGVAWAEVQNVKDSICSAVDVMQAMASSICSSLSKVDETNSLVTELSIVAAKERALLSECRDLLSNIAVKQGGTGVNPKPAKNGTVVPALSKRKANFAGHDT